MLRICCALALLLVVVLVGGGSAAERTIHVSAGGRDDGAGTRASPLRSLEAAVERARDGDTVLVLPGTYRAGARITRSGITLRGSADGPAVIRLKTGSAVELAPGASRIRIEGFRIEGGIWAISLQGGNRQVRIADCEISGAESGIHMTEGERGSPAHGGVEDVAIERCTVTRSQYTAIDATPGPARRLTIRGCRIEKNGAESGYGGDGVGIEVGDHVVVEDCVIRGNGGDGVDLSSRNRGPSQGNVVRRCRIVGNGTNGVKLWRGGRIDSCLIAGTGATGVVFKYGGAYHLEASTVAANARRDRDYALVAGYDDDPSTGEAPRMIVSIERCIFAFNGPPAEPTGLYVGRGATLRERDNVFYSRDDEELLLAGRAVEEISREAVRAGRWPRHGGDEHAGSRSVDPQFVDLGAGDFRLRAGSPAHGLGASDAVAR